MSKLAISMGGYQPPASVHNRAAEIFGQELKKRLWDDVDFDLDGNMPASLGCKADDLPKMVDKGELTMCYFASSYLTENVPEMRIFDLPFVVDSREKAYAALDGELGDLLRKKYLEKTGWRVLAFWDNGFRHFTNSKRAMRTPSDCEGLSVRSMDSVLHQEFFRLLGMEPRYVDVRDLVEAAKSGELDAQENPLTNTYRFGTYKYHRHITLSGHFFGASLVLINSKTFESWSEDIQKAVIESIETATKAQRGFAQAEDEEILSALDPSENDVVKLTDEERAQFKTAVGPLLAKQRDAIGSKIFEMVE
jgi:TRAP-type C4-dicarboxylate transport system substrate-binding protein